MHIEGPETGYWSLSWPRVSREAFANGHDLELSSGSCYNITS